MMNASNRAYATRVGLVVLGVAIALGASAAHAAAAQKPVPPNVLVFPVDDMDFATLNANGCPVKGLTPHMDRLAREGIQFRLAHLNCAVCQPSRQSLMTGLHTHRNGTLGFVPVPPGVPNLSELLMAQGWFTASFNKGRDYKSFRWSHFKEGYGSHGFGRDAKLFVADARATIEEARKEGKPFLLNVATSDPHRPFAGSEQERVSIASAAKRFPQAAAAGKIYRPPFKVVCAAEQAWVPPYLPDLPEIRKEWAQYYNTVHRADETLGSVLKLLDEEGVAGNTIVIFYSDNGASFPTSKQNCYPYSTQTPLIIRWPGVVKPGTLDQEHMVSIMDILPTVLEIAGAPVPRDLDGRSLLALLQGKKQPGREHVFTSYNYITPGVQVYPMRAVHTRDCSYIFNAWSDGKTRFGGECHSGLTFAAMEDAAKRDPAIALRVQHILYRQREELYDLTQDPWCLKNLAADPAAAATRDRMRKLLEQEMRATNDPLLPAFVGTGEVPKDWLFQKSASKTGKAKAE